ncbi:MAG TPA: hypothetical protein DCZ10_11325 [Pelotomaculum sp.]|nr:hypothetical protein [Pelotomaculum sp.]
MGAFANVEKGCEDYEKFKSSSNKKTYYQYDYRHTDGKLFSCVAPTLEACRAKRDNWLKAEKPGGGTPG